MQSRDITEILNKIDEMRAVFVLGQRAVPFLEEVFYFLKEISPLMDEINSSIRESTATMPRATSQLQSVSAATELATTEIMDLVDAVLAQLGPMRSGIDDAASTAAKIDSSMANLHSSVSEAFADAGLEISPAIEKIFAEQMAATADLATRFDRLSDVEDIRAKVNRIMISLQVQDITAQQIASVNHLIESIRDKMNTLVDRLGWSAKVSEKDAWPVYTHSNFDPHARYDRDTSRQSMIDDVIATSSGNDVVAPSQARASVDASTDPAAESTPAIGPASQAEIDALFQNGFPS